MPNAWAICPRKENWVLTNKPPAGESREGEGRAAGPTSDQILASLIKAYIDEGREPREIHLMRTTEDRYSVIVWIHGEPEADEISYFSPSEAVSLGLSLPNGDTSGTRGGQ